LLRGIKDGDFLRSPDELVLIFFVQAVSTSMVLFLKRIIELFDGFGVVDWLFKME